MGQHDQQANADEVMRICVGVLAGTGLGMLMWVAAITLAHYMR